MAGHVGEDCFGVKLSLILGIMNSTDRREEKRNFLIQGRRFRRSFNPFTTEAAKSGQPEMAFSSQSGQKRPREYGKFCLSVPSLEILLLSCIVLLLLKEILTNQIHPTAHIIFDLVRSVERLNFRHRFGVRDKWRYLRL